eukprot:TRINITY_DN792_c0_g1_i2.p1 TRINITY_DN792_c0_g1~~TRINITY_DN792_c0_g1_i2.p1  ORF type:complete len:562 (+),score=98.80 TRINITY_DN792_c0_g1_i2:35-1720(+)
MAITSRAGRGGCFPQQTTGAGIGPGSYQTLGNGLLKGSSGKYSIPPFSSSVERGGGVVVAQTPGPGHYSSPAPGAGGELTGSKMSSQFASKTARMYTDLTLTKKSVTPGPGSYSASELWVHSTPAPVSKSQKNNKIINWVKVATAPSIPAPTQSYGYEEGTKGELIPGKPPHAGHAGCGYDTAGPGEYEPSDTLQKKKPAALNFGKSRTGRGVGDVAKEVATAPGPGHYNPSVRQQEPTDEEKKLNSVFASATKRVFVSKEAASKPGPGTYNAPLGFAAHATQMAALNPNSAQAFGMTLPKHEAMAIAPKESPGPGQYKCQSNFDSQKDKWAVTHGGFSTTSVRFNAPATTEKQTPGPGHYTDGTEGNTALSSKLHRRMNGRYGVFGTTSQRFPSQKIEKELGPGSYDPKTVLKPADARRKDMRMAAFVSNVARMPKAKHSTPGVGEYDASRSSGVPGGFVPGELRFKPEKPSQSPGPGEYVASHGTIDAKILGPPVLVNGKLTRLQNGTTDKSGSKRSIGDRALRFPVNKLAHQPGPGHYETNGTLIKRTFNITIGDTWD